MFMNKFSQIHTYKFQKVAKEVDRRLKWNSKFCIYNFPTSICNTYLDWSVHIRSCLSEVKEHCDRQTNGEPVYKTHIVDESVHVWWRQVN